MGFIKKNVLAALAVGLLVVSVALPRIFLAQGMFDGLFVNSTDQLALSTGTTINTTNGADHLLLLGGRIGTTSRNDVFSSTDMENWSLVSQNDPASTSIWSPRYHANAVYFNNKYWVIGTANVNDPLNTISSPNDIWSSVDGVTWTLVNTNPPFNNYYASSGEYYEYQAAVLGNKLYVIGGKPGNNNKAVVWSSVDGVSWNVETASAPFEKRVFFSLVANNGTLYIIGGRYGINSYGNTGVWSSADGVNWTQLTANPPFTTYVAYAKALSYNNMIYLLGGNYQSATSGYGLTKVWSSADGANWTLVGNTLPPDASYTAFINRDAVVANGKMWVSNTAGFNNMTNTLWSSTDGLTWTASPSTPSWSARLGYVFVSDHVDTPPIVATCKAELTTPATTTVASNMSIATSWISNCDNIVVKVTSGSYTLKYVGAGTGTHTFVAPAGTVFSSTDAAVDVTLIAGNDIDSTSTTKSVQIVDAPAPTSSQCVFISIKATPNPVPTGSSQTILSWLAPTRCVVYLESWTPTTHGLVYAQIPKPGTGYFNSSDSMGVSLNASTTYYLTAQAGTGTTLLNSTKTIDVKVQ